MRFTTSKQSLISEFTGTFSLVFFGCGSIILSEISNLKSEYIPFIFGCTIAFFIYIFGKYSGAHFNPAVTIGFFVNKEISLRDGFLYITVQTLGAVGASFTHSLIFENPHSFGTTTVSTTFVSGSVAEILCTAFLMLVILLVTRNDNRIYGLAIGGAVTISALLIGDMTGASLNPARSIGPILLYGNINELWFYIITPICGAVGITKLYKVIA